MPEKTVQIPVLNLKHGEEIFTYGELMHRVGVRYDLPIREEPHREPVSTEPLMVREVTDEMLIFLEQAEVASYHALTPFSLEIGFSDRDNANRWVFPIGDGKEDRRITLYLRLEFDPRERGVVLIPMTRAPGASPIDDAPHDRMFRLIARICVEHFSMEHGTRSPVITDFATRDHQQVVSLTYLGLGGLRRCEDLFAEFACGNVMIEQLAQSDVSPFIPWPYVHSHGSQDNPLYWGRHFLVEAFQPGLFKTWAAQLEQFREGLYIP